MYDLSNSVEDSSLATVMLSGENGFETVGSNSDASYSKVLEYSASESQWNSETLVAPL